MNTDNTQTNNDIDIDAEITSLTQDLKSIEDDLTSAHKDALSVLDEETNNLDSISKNIDDTASELNLIEEEASDKIDTLTLDYVEELAKEDDEDSNDTE
jgi:hypothetical protein